MKPIFLGFILFYLHNMLYITEIFCNFAISETFFLIRILNIQRFYETLYITD